MYGGVLTGRLGSVAGKSNASRNLHFKVSKASQDTLDGRTNRENCSGKTLNLISPKALVTVMVPSTLSVSVFATTSSASSAECSERTLRVPL